MPQMEFQLYSEETLKVNPVKQWEDFFNVI